MPLAHFRHVCYVVIMFNLNVVTWFPRQ